MSQLVIYLINNDGICRIADATAGLQLIDTKYYCRLGGRAVKGFELLQSLGFSQTKVYKGSMKEWEERGGEVVKTE